MAAQRRQLVLLAVLLGALVLVSGRSFLRLSASGGGLAGTLVGSRRAPSFAEVLGTRVATLRSGELLAETAEFSPGRDLWRYGSVPRPVAQELPPVVRAAPPPVREPEPVEPPRPRPPAVDVKYLGSFGSEGRKIAVFTDAEDVLINALVGDVVKGKFRVATIGYESVELAFVGFPDEPPARLPLDGAGRR